VFETILGIPAHPLLIHAAVVFVPLLIVGALAYVLIPRLRGRIGWAVALLAIVGPLSALAAKLSGDAFRARLVTRHLASAQIISKVDQHRHFGTLTTIISAILGVVTLILVLVPAARQRGVLQVILAVVTIGLGVATGYYIFRTGDTGAHIVWSGY
jgi:uncharacterized membrane protein